MELKLTQNSKARQILRLIGLAFLISYLTAGNIDKAYGSDKDKFKATHSLFFFQSGQKLFYTSNINTNLNAISFRVYTPHKYTRGETTNNRIISALEKGNIHSVMPFDSTSANITGETFIIGGQNEATAITETIPKGWNHIAINWSGSNGHFEIYLNGGKTTVLHRQKFYAQINNFQSYFGKEGGKNSNYYYVSIDEISIWSRLLADSFIKQLPYQVLDVSQTELEACYRFNAGSRTNISEFPNYGNNGTLSQAGAWLSTSGPGISDSLAQVQSETQGIYSNQSNATSDKLVISGTLGNNPLVVLGHDNKSGVTGNDQPTSTSYATLRISDISSVYKTQANLIL